MNKPDYLDVPKQFPPDWASAYGQDGKGYWLELSLYNEEICFRWIPTGQFTMGSDSHEKGRYDFETQHTVTLSEGFWLADTTVNQALYQAVVGDNPSHFKGNPNNPVEQVSWDDARQFIEQLNTKVPELQARLPSETQWEYACRAGTTTAFSFGDNITPEQVNYDGNSPYAGAKKGLYREQTVVVKSLPVNPWGLYEMHGNVWEWCQDNCQKDLGQDPVTDPQGIESGAGRVLRGGSWIYGGGGVRSAMRGGSTPDGRSEDSGLRLSLGLELRLVGGAVNRQGSQHALTRRDVAALRARGQGY